MYYVYVLLSGVDGGFYTGSTGDLKHRVQEHSEGLVETTRDRRPLELVYYEACNSRKDACRREKYLKTGAGKWYLRNRLREHLETLTG
ncbi:MAG TPA: GIY-YIG nuclease family protein [Phycisphaerales bacterium]|nr:GIY-YIG nuclease family protein [Phycisphaerales bacterium]